MEEFKFTLISCTPENKRAKPSFLGFYLVNTQIGPQYIQISPQQQDSQSITLRYDDSSEHVYLELNIFEKSWLFGRKWRAYINISLEKLRSHIGEMNLKLNDDNDKIYARLIMKVAVHSLQPLANLINPLQTIKHVDNGSPTIIISTTDNELQALNVHESEPLVSFFRRALDQDRLRVSYIKSYEILQEEYKMLESNFAKVSKKNEFLENSLANMSKGNKYLRELEEKFRNLENENAANTKKHRKELHLLECQLSEERQKVTETAAELEKLGKSYNENKVELQQRERDIIQLRKNTAATSQQPMETGIYPLGEVDPSKISENWRSIYEDLYYILLEALQQSQNPASEQYRKLIRHDTRAQNYPRHHSYAIIREISFLLCKFYRRIVVNTDESLELNEEDDLVDSLMKYVMTTSNRCDFAKHILGFLAPPNNIDAELPLFEKLPGGPKIFLEDILKKIFEHVNQVTQAYNISSEEVDTYLKTVIYTAIYTTFQMSVIGNNFVSFWSDTFWDYEILNVPQHEDSLAPYAEKFNNKLETVELPEVPEDPHVLFTVFPGCLYTNTSGEIKVIERSQVVCCKNS